MTVLLTGGSGRLGTELRRLIPSLIAPPRSEMDVESEVQVEEVIDRHSPRVVVHAAAYTNVSGAERERARCWSANVGGTRNVARAANRRNAALVHISTDYVFAGTDGGYRESDPPGPPLNHYALSKIAAEEVARVAGRHLVIRTSFRPRSWPYPVAYDDMFTSQDYVDLIAPKIALAVVAFDEIEYETTHIATERKSVFELARRRAPDVRAGSRTEAPVELPADISLDVGRWERTEARLRPRFGELNTAK